MAIVSEDWTVIGSRFQIAGTATKRACLSILSLVLETAEWKNWIVEEPFDKLDFQEQELYFALSLPTLSKSVSFAANISFKDTICFSKSVLSDSFTTSSLSSDAPCHMQVHSV